MSLPLKILPALALALALSPLASAYAQQPIGPTITALPGHGISQKEFQSADITCRNDAQARTDLPGATPASLYRSQPPVISQQKLYNVIYGQCMAARGSAIDGNAVDPTPFYPYAFPGYSSVPGMGQ